MHKCSNVPDLDCVLFDTTRMESAVHNYVLLHWLSPCLFAPLLDTKSLHQPIAPAPLWKSSSLRFIFNDASSLKIPLFHTLLLSKISWLCPLNAWADEDFYKWTRQQSRVSGASGRGGIAVNHRFTSNSHVHCSHSSTGHQLKSLNHHRIRYHLRWLFRETGRLI